MHIWVTIFKSPYPQIDTLKAYLNKYFCFALKIVQNNIKFETKFDWKIRETHTVVTHVSFLLFSNKVTVSSLTVKLVCSLEDKFPK